MHGNQWVLKIAVLKYYSVSKRVTTAKSNPKQATDPISLHTKFGDNSSNTFPLNERKPCVTPDIGRRTSDGRKSKNNISTPRGVDIIKDIIDYCTFYNKPGLVILVDFAKAFDSLTWSFLFKCLKTMNFGDRFIDCVKMLYNDIQICVINNGKSSQFFNLHRGIRQGCCLSALLFIIVVEYLSTDIRDNKGITSGDHEYLINQLADDTTLFINSEDCLTHAFDRIERFGLCSGQKRKSSP